MYVLFLNPKKVNVILIEIKFDGMLNICLLPAWAIEREKEKKRKNPKKKLLC